MASKLEILLTVCVIGQRPASCGLPIRGTKIVTTEHIRSEVYERMIPHAYTRNTSTFVHVVDLSKHFNFRRFTSFRKLRDTTIIPICLQS